jgi:drug/metabolite transporter (DMT)-like permease
MQWKYILFALFISFLWGSQPVVHKHLLKKYNAPSMMMFTAIINAILVFILSIYNRDVIYSDLIKINYIDASIIIGVVSLTVFLANIIYYYILKKHESSIISALIYSSPVFTLIIAYLFLKERLDIYGISGIFSIVLGVILITNNNSSSQQLEFLDNR